MSNWSLKVTLSKKESLYFQSYHQYICMPIVIILYLIVIAKSLKSFLIPHPAPSLPHFPHPFSHQTLLAQWTKYTSTSLHVYRSNFLQVPCILDLGYYSRPRTTLSDSLLVFLWNLFPRKQPGWLVNNINQT